MQGYLMSANGSNLPQQMASTKFQLHARPNPSATLFNNRYDMHSLPHHNQNKNINTNWSFNANQEGILSNYLTQHKPVYGPQYQSKFPLSKNGQHTFYPPIQIPVTPQISYQPNFSIGCPILAPGNYHSRLSENRNNQELKARILPKYAGFKTLTAQQRKVQNQKPKQKLMPRIDTKIEEQKIFCVLCQATYSNNEKEEHIRKHKRGSKDEKIKKLSFLNKQGHIQYQLRPIVEPEQYNIQYNPNKFVLQEQKHFQTKSQIKPAFRQISLDTNGGPPVSGPNEEESKIEIRNTVISNERTNSTRIPKMRQENMDSMIDDQYSSNKTKNANQKSSNSIKRNSPQNQNQYQGGFSKNTFISDKPETISIQNNSNNDYTNSNQNVRETITSYYFNDSSLKNAQKNSQFYYNNKIQNAFDPSRMMNALPLRNTVQSLQQSQSYQNASEFKNLEAYPKYVDSQQYYMHMPQIRQQSENRNTNSQVFKEDISILEGGKKQNNRESEKIQGLANSRFQPILSDNLQSLVNKKVKNVDTKQIEEYEGIGSKSQQVSKYQGSLFIDDYLFQNLQASQKIIPKQQNHMEAEHQIPIDYIIQQRKNY